MGAPAKSFRMVLGALIIKEKLGISDRKTVAITFLVMNLSTHLSWLFSAFLYLFLKTTPFFRFNIIMTYDFTSYTQEKLLFVPCLNN